MNNFLNQLNLTPQERRIVAIIFLVVIVVLNLLFVWPHFGEWGSINRQLEDMRQKIADENRLIANDRNPTNGVQKQVVKLIRKENVVSTERPVDPQVQLQNTILKQERQTGVYIPTRQPGTPKTNDAFFEEHSTTITIESQEPQLVNFLFNMGNDPAMIRVAKLDLKPLDANRYKLHGSITLTANYAKKPPAPAGAAKPDAKPGGPVTPKPAAPGAAKPATAPGARPAGPPSPGQTPNRAPTGPPSPGSRPQPALPGKPALPMTRRVPVPQ